MYSYILNAIRSFSENIWSVQKSIEKDQPNDKVDDLIKDIDGPIEKCSVDKPIYRKFTVQPPYNGPPQIVLPHDEELVTVDINGKYISMRVTNFEDYGTDDEDEKIKVVYNILVEPFWHSTEH